MNILFLLIDCLRSSAVAHSSRVKVTPTIDALARRGTLFTTAVSTATTTTPSVASLLTGTLPFAHGVRSLLGYKLNPEVATLSQILRDHGYFTHAETTGPLTTHTGMHKGFESYVHRSGNLYTPHWSKMMARLDALPKARPWFCFVHMFELHEPPAVPKGFRSRRFGTTPYERSLSALDHMRLSRLVELADSNTLIVVTGDHGEIVPRLGRTIRGFEKLCRMVGLRRARSFFERRHGHGFSVHDDVTLVPFLMAGPGVPKDRIIGTTVRHIDWLPTALELAGIRDERGRQGLGTSLTDLFDVNGQDRPSYSEAVGVRLPGPESWLVSVRHRGFKLVKRVDGSRRWLWQLPDERRNRIDEFPEVAQDLELLLSSFRNNASLDSTGEGLSMREKAEVEEHLRDLGYLD